MEEDSLLRIVDIDEVAMKYGISCEICGSQIALVLGGLEVRILEEGDGYVSLIQVPLPADYLDDYLLGEYARRYCLLLNLFKEGVLREVKYELREDIPSLVVRTALGNLGEVSMFVERLVSAYEKIKNSC